MVRSGASARRRDRRRWRRRAAPRRSRRAPLGGPCGPCRRPSRRSESRAASATRSSPEAGAARAVGDHAVGADDQPVPGLERRRRLARVAGSRGRRVRARPACRAARLDRRRGSTIGATCPQLTISSLNVAGIPASDDRRHLRRRAGHLAQRPVHQHQRLVGRAAAAPAGAQRAERDRAARGGARAGTEPVGERDPDAVEVLDEVEPVARDLVAGQHVARHLAAADPRDARRQQALLDLGRGARLLAPLAARERVGVAIGERDRRRGLARDLGERAPRPARASASRPSPARGARAGRPRSPRRSRELGAQLGQSPAESSSGPIASGTSIRSGRRSGPATRSRCEPSMSTTYSAQRDLGDPLRLRHELLGQHRRAPRRRRRGCPRASTGPSRPSRPGGSGCSAVSAVGREAPRSGRRRRGRRGRGSAGRASSGTRRPPPRYRPSAPRATARAGGGSPRRSSAGSGACPRGRHPRSSLGGSAGGGQDMRPIVPRFCPMSRVRHRISGELAVHRPLAGHIGPVRSGKRREAERRST